MVHLSSKPYAIRDTLRAKIHGTLAKTRERFWGLNLSNLPEKKGKKKKKKRRIYLKAYLQFLYIKFQKIIFLFSFGK